MLSTDAAQVLDRSPQWVRLGLQRGVLPIGCAVLMPGGTWVYDIRPERLAQYMGITVEEMRDRLERVKSA